MLHTFARHSMCACVVLYYVQRCVIGLQYRGTKGEQAHQGIFLTSNESEVRAKVSKISLKFNDSNLLPTSAQEKKNKEALAEQFNFSIVGCIISTQIL